jgi:hypothetical protein
MSERPPQDPRTADVVGYDEAAGSRLAALIDQLAAHLGRTPAR